MTHKHTFEAAIKHESSLRYWEILKSTARYVLSRTIIRQWRTDRIVLPGSSRILYVDPTENRGRILYMTGGMTQPRLNLFWKTAVANFRPTLIIDVGVNYGECLFSVTYPKNSKIIGIEANPHLQPFIERSKKIHPNRKKINTVYAMASNEDSDKQSFFINKYWSGLSTAALGKEDVSKAYQQHDVPSITLDSLLSQYPLDKEKLLFKIDVEGHEEKVIQGMLNSIKNCPNILGFIEFDSKYLAKSDTDAHAFLTFLQVHFNLYVYLNNQELYYFEQISLEKLQLLFKKKHIHTDIILASPGVTIPEIYSQIIQLD
ncbi:FkbM family methyltransferase [Paenibacillus alginolyticus]|uniref:FkbM family methyltransferase n=1 Tax=Paenibacillus alginolyticus TaxID=59839 RepID=A0ABT4G6C6_9BACL|nr:FkbM family methyltransferase [Paenibacillus alginolyticus]MCY9667773.1 FkbM family methyltransferase [Paenibacillus alginolyticus]MCY9691707.1 FkbM family methyltransferase [Paenibacillus alginolyticus]MEC0144057.1 FkbM family methyltransferase [Paenibacillus alginolyticus]